MTSIRNSIENSISDIKGELSRAFNSKAATAVRALIEGSSVGYKTIALAAGIGLLAVHSLPVTAAIVLSAAALTAFVTINEYKELRNNQQPMPGPDVESIETGLSQALKMAKRIPRLR